MMKGRSKWIALVLALVMMLSASALAVETSSEPFRVEGAKQRSEEAVTEPEPEVEPEPDAEPEPEPAPLEKSEKAPEKPEASEEPEAEEIPTYEYERDEDGNLLLDENGDPIPVIPEGATEKPAAYQRDESGALVLDESGNPIPTQFVPVDAEIIVTETDETYPERRIDVYINWVETAEEHAYGDEAVLTAVLTGYDGLEYVYQWQTSKDDVSYTDVEGATEVTYTFPVTEENLYDYWRVEVTITDVVA